MSKAEIYSAIYEISKLVHYRNLTDKKKNVNLLIKLKEIIKTLESEERV